MFKSFYFKTIGLLLAMFVGGGNLEALAEQVTYTITSRNSVKATGNTITGTTASYSQTFADETGKITTGNSATLTVADVPANVAITGITLTIKTNKKAGKGNAIVTLGNTQFGALAIPCVGSNYVDKSMLVTKTFGPGDLVIDISAIENSVYIQKYVITYIIDNRKDPEISYSQESCSIKLDGSTPTPTLSYKGDGTVTFSSSNTNAATIDADGNITPIAQGLTVITASISGTDEYRDGMAKYTLTVGKLLWKEDFSSYSNEEKPTGGDYGYACTGSNTLVRLENYAEGDAPELLIQKDRSFSANIPLNRYYGDFVLMFNSNEGATIATTTTGVTIGTVNHNNTLYSVTISVPERTETLNLSFNSTVNTRLDNIYLFAPDRVENVVIEIKGLGIRTYASDYALDFSEVEGLTAYAATGITGDKLTMTKVGQVAAGEGLMLKGTASTTYTVPIVDEAEAIQGNMLVGLTAKSTTVYQVDGEYTTFILANVDDDINWYMLLEESYSFGPNIAYLKLPTSDVPTTRALTMEYGSDTDGINSITPNAYNSNNVYDLQGRKVTTLNKKGIYIIGGRKVVMK